MSVTSKQTTQTAFIRGLSLLLKVAEALDEFKPRVIYGFSTGTLEDDVTHSFETGTALVSKRLAALKKLQEQGYRTFGMLCPALPQADYGAFAKKVAEKIDINKCEHFWAEVLNDRGDAMKATSKALRNKGFTVQADSMDRVANDPVEWDKYAEQTFLALSEVIPPRKLRFLQYVDRNDYHIWRKHEGNGAVLLGKHSNLVREVMGNADLDEEEPLNEKEKQALEDCEAIIQENGRQFVQVGLALKQIAGEKLYRGTHSTFDSYCLSRFDFGRVYGYRLINAAQVVEDLKEELKGKVLPIGEWRLVKAQNSLTQPFASGRVGQRAEDDFAA